MKIYVTQLVERYNQNVLRLSFIFLLCFVSSVWTADASDIFYNVDLVENETNKMSVIPDASEENKAIIQLHSATSEANIIIFNAMGIVVFEKSFDAEIGQENYLRLDLSGFRSGTYYIVHDESKDAATYSVK